MFRVMFSCSATVPGCFAVPPVFPVPCSSVPGFLVRRNRGTRLNGFQQHCMAG